MWSSSESDSGFAERVSGRDDFDHLLGALRGQERELDLAINDEVKPDARIAAIEHGFAARHVQLGRAHSDAVELFGREFLEERQP